MKNTRLTKLEIASLCRELALLLHAGVGAGDGLALMAEEEPNEGLRALLARMAERVDSGVPLPEAMEETECFPAYGTGLVKAGERTGRTEEALDALARYDEGRGRVDQRLRSALT